MLNKRKLHLCSIYFRLQQIFCGNLFPNFITFISIDILLMNITLDTGLTLIFQNQNFSLTSNQLCDLITLFLLMKSILGCVLRVFCDIDLYFSAFSLIPFHKNTLWHSVTKILVLHVGHSTSQRWEFCEEMTSVDWQSYPVFLEGFIEWLLKSRSLLLE